MKKKPSRQDMLFHIFFGLSTFLSVYVMALLRKLEGDPTLKMLTDILVVLLLLALNTAVLVLHEKNKSFRK